MTGIHGIIAIAVILLVWIFCMIIYAAVRHHRRPDRRFRTSEDKVDSDNKLA